MKTYSSATTAYRAAGNAHYQVDFLSFRVKSFSDPNDFQWYHFCSDDDDITVSVINPDSGETVERTFYGGGHIVELDALIRSEGPVVRSMNWTLSGASNRVLDMLYGHNCREATAQYFIGEINRNTGLFVDTPATEFVGAIEAVTPSDAGLENGSPVADSTVTVSVNSIGSQLLRVNGDMRAVETSMQRDGDEIFEYSDSAADWVRPWGRKSKSKRDRDGGKKDKKQVDNDYFGGSDN